MRVYLRAFRPEDYLSINKWRHDPVLMAHVGGNVIFVSPEREKRWVESKIFDDREAIYLAICLKENDEMIGYLSISNIDWRNRKAELGGILIGRRDLWNQGYGAEAGRLMLEHVFFEMGLHRFYGYWLEENAGSIRMAEKLGLKKEGLLRHTVFKGNRWHNQWVMGVLKEEFEAVIQKIDQK